MPLAVRQRQVMPTGATYNAPITPIGINDSVYNAAKGLADETANLSFQLHQKMAAVDMMSEWSDFEGFVNQQRAEADKFRQSNIDGDLPNGKTVYGDDWDKRVQAITDYANKNLRYGDTKQKALAHITAQKGVWDWQLNNDAFASRADTALRKFDEYQNTVMTANYSTDLMAENSARKQYNERFNLKKGDSNYKPELSDKDFRLNLIEQRANELASTGLIHQRVVPDIISRADASLRKIEKENVFNAANDTLTKIAETIGNWEDALLILEKPEILYQSRLDKKQADELIKNIKSLDTKQRETLIGDINSRINVEKKIKQIEFDKQSQAAIKEAERLLLDPAIDARQILKLKLELSPEIDTNKNQEARDDINTKLEDIAEAKKLRDKNGLPKTNSKAYNESIDALLGYYEDLDSKAFNDIINDNWLGITIKTDKNGKITDVERGIGRLSDEDRAKILRLSGKEMPYATLQGLKEAVNFGKEKMPNWFTGKEKDTNRIAEYNKSLIDWIDRNTDPENKKYPSAEEVFKQSRIIYGLIKNPPQKKNELSGTMIGNVRYGEFMIEKSPFKEYPDAYKQGDNWYVMRNGKRYRVEE